MAKSEVTGLVVKTHNRFYQVTHEGETYMCSPKGNFKNTASAEYRLPVIGDHVAIELTRDTKDPKKVNHRDGVDGYILNIQERDNRLLRADPDGRRERVMAANLDLLVVVSAVCQPGIDFPMIDRFILSSELSSIPYRLIINKCELDPGFVEEEPTLDAYRAMGIEVLATSAKTGEGIDTLREWAKEGIIYFTGTSGVGKSTLINCLAPDVHLPTGEVDERKGHGRHTTTLSTLVPIPGGGYLIDSPGLRDFFPPKVAPEEVRFGFREIAAIQSHCKFSSCIHDMEPDCAVAMAVERGIISPERYKSYLFLLNEMKTFQADRFS